MKISVIIPIYNLGQQIITALDSIYSQDFDKSEYEVLTIFDSCTDDSEALVSEWAKRHSDITVKFFYSQCKTPGGTRNVGLDNASGDYIMFIDGDDYLMNNSSMTIVNAAIQGHNAVRVMDHGVSGTRLKFSKRLTMWLHIFSRELIGEDRFTDMLLCEDFEFVKRIRNKSGYNEAIVNTPLYFYNYDNERMNARIKNVFELSRGRDKSLPPLFVDDEFVVCDEEKRREFKERCKNHNG